ncbi:MAG: PQQ-binding-like beta-propeller repeat protein [Actinomycetota bacterium]|nr:PQQ-binding-like beta-propeller repeat protein [Actinomycetota bacterium]
MTLKSSNPTKIPAGLLGRASLVAALIALAVALAGCGSSSKSGSGTSTSSQASAVGQAPPEWAANAGSWPAHNYGLANTRATTNTDINATNVAKLTPKWRFKLPYIGQFGAYTSNPIVLDGVVYIEDPDSDVYALNQQTGAVMWKHLYKSVTPSGGPNGLALGYGLLFGATEGAAFALNPKNGAQVWMHKLIGNKLEGIDMTPQLYDGKVLISTIPGSSTNFYQGGAFGTVYSLDAKTGKTIWSFQTVKGGAKLFGNPKVNSGGGLWYPPSVDSHGRVFLSVANPAPLYGTPKFPNGSSRPGPNLYTDSLVALDGQTGKLLWFRQAIPHDLRDYDLMIPAITATVPIQGVQTEVELVAGKMGKAYAYRADNGQHLWTRSVGKHQNDTGPLPSKPIDVFPGIFGGVETPMAYAANRLFVPWLNFPTHASASGIAGGLGNFKTGTGGLTAIDPGTGKVLWQNKLPSEDFGAATVANDVVFTSTYAGTIYAFDTKTGKTLWTAKAPAGINSFPAVTKDLLIVGAGGPGNLKNPQYQIVAYSLNAPAGGAKTQSTASPSAGSGVSGNAGSSASAQGTAIQVKGGEFFFRLSTKSIAKPGKVTFAFSNIGHVAHDFKINGKMTPLIQPGQTASLAVTFTKAGSYPYLCTVPGHAEAGMKGVFTVR